MARVVAASEANQNFSKLLRELKRGDPVTITQRGRVRARLVDAEDGVDFDKQARAFEAALAHYRTLDRVLLRGWTRDSLYERDPWTRSE